MKNKKSQSSNETYITNTSLQLALTSSFTDLKKYLDDNFFTKEDAKAFATKEDLERFATKEDLERFATKEDLQEFREETSANFERLFEGAYETGEALQKHEKKITALEHRRN